MYLVALRLAGCIFKPSPVAPSTKDPSFFHGGLSINSILDCEPNESKPFRSEPSLTSYSLTHCSRHANPRILDNVYWCHWRSLTSRSSRWPHKCPIIEKNPCNIVLVAAFWSNSITDVSIPCLRRLAIAPYHIWVTHS